MRRANYKRYSHSCVVRCMENTPGCICTASSVVTMTSNQKTSSRVPACLEMKLESQVRDNGYKNTYSEVMISSLVVLGRVMEIIRHSNFNHGFFIGVDEIVQSQKKRLDCSNLRSISNCADDASCLMGCKSSLV